MTLPDPGPADRPGPDAAGATLSTGERVPLPLPCEASVAGAVLSAPAGRLATALPDGLVPVRVTPRRGAVVLAVVSYSRVADLDPYREFAVIVPATRPPAADAPLQSLGSAGGYVAYLPVTTPESTALGREVWGYPKETVEIDVADRGRTRRATVRRDGRRVLSLAVTRPRAVAPARGTVDSYVAADDLREVPVALRGRVGVARGGVALSVGEGDRAADLRAIGLGDRCRPLARFAAPALRARVFPGVPG